MKNKKNCADYREFIIQENGKEREIVAPDFKSRVQEHINKNKQRKEV